MAGDRRSEAHEPEDDVRPLSPAEYRRLLESSPDVVFKSVGGTVRWVSPAITELAGWRPEDLVGKTAAHLVHPDDREVAAALRGRVYGGEASRGAFRLRTKDGGHVWVDASVRPYRDETGETGAVGAFRDIGEHIAAEQALAASEERYRLLADNVTDVLWVLDLDTSLYTYISPSVERLSGYTQSELIGVPIEERLTPESAQRARAVIGEALAAYEKGDTAAAIVDEIELLRKDGGVAPAEVSARFLPSPDGRPHLVLGVSRDIRERRAAERAVKESEARYRALVDSAVDAIVTADARGTITAWNAAAERLFGYSQAESVGRPMTMLMPARYAAEHPAAMERFRAGGGGGVMGKVVVLVGVRRDGAEFPIELSLADWEVAGEPFVTAIVRDLSKRHEAERALRESEERYRTLYEGSPIAIELYDADSRLVSVNPACLELFGVSDARELSGFDLFADPNIGDEHKERLRRAETVRYQGPFDFEAVKALGLYRTSRGGVIWLDALITPIGTATVGYLVQVQEITAQREAEADLREMHDRLDLAQRAAGAGTWDLDMQTGGATWSRRLFELLGLDPATTTAGTALWESVMHPDDQAAAQAAQTAALADRAMLDVEYRIVRPDGAVRWINALGRGVYDEGGVPLRMIGLCIDITERRQAQDEIRRLNAELEERVRERTRALEATNEELQAFAYSVSHDLRAPLRAIDGFSQVLLEDNFAALDEAGRDSLQRVRAAAQKMGQLIDALLALSRLSRRELGLGRVDLSRLAAAAVARLHEQEPERLVRTEIAAGCTAIADAALVDDVLANLLGNAWKFTSGREEAHIELGETVVDAERVFFVRDNGVGFDQAYVGKLFEPFQRLHPAGEFPGTGIGLATVRRIVTRLGGRCWAEGVVGEGATFYFTLPTPAGDAPGPA